MTPEIEAMRAAEARLRALGAACEDRGDCRLANQFNLEKLRHEFAHWPVGHAEPDHTLTMVKPDLAIVKAWLGAIHQ